MKGLQEMGQVQEINPYVMQATRLSESLSYLSELFNAKVSGGKNYEDSDVVDIVRRVMKIYDGGTQPEENEMFVLVEKILEDIEAYGEELSIKNGRLIEKECMRFEEVKSIVQEEFTKIKRRRLEEGRHYEEREACMSTLSTYANASRDVARELEKSIFEDKRIQKKLRTSLKKMGVKMLKSTILVSKQGGFECLMTLKARKDTCVRTKVVAKVISTVLGRRMEAEMDEKAVLGKEYSTLQFRQCPSYHITHGVAQVSKDGSKRSGDNFLVMDVRNGKKAVIISDGMGSGEKAYHMSGRILDAIESLLASGMSLKNAISICNSMLVSSQKGMDFGTLDVCVFDTYGGSIEIAKAGGSYTYLFSNKRSVCVEPKSLPVGVINGIEPDYVKEQVKGDTFLVMMTDGVSELIKDKDRGGFIEDIICETKSNNPNELSLRILDEVLKSNGHVASDDMMVVVVGCWKIKG